MIHLALRLGDWDHETDSETSGGHRDGLRQD